MNVQHLVVPASAAIAALAATLFSASAADAAASVTVNGSAVDLSPPPIVRDGRVFVPLRGVFEQLGANVNYANGTISATGNGRDIFLQIGSTQATVNDQPQTIDVAPFIVGASTYVPLRFVSEALGDSVNWDDASSTAQIDTGGGSATYFSPGTASYVDTAPPPIPVYQQPYVPAPNYIWQPGYWAWGSYGYYWVPGTWVEAPQTGYLWTPGYWEWNNYGFVWVPGYWAQSVGYYGGVNYGGGYGGQGYDGGQWSPNGFRYNTFVTRVDVTIVRNVYVNRNVYINPSATRTSYNGGRGGLLVRPTTQQIAVVKQRHLGMTVVQQKHVAAAEQDRRLLASVNHDKPPVLAVARPLNAAVRPAGFVPVKPADRVNPLANVAPVRVAPVRVAPVPAAPVRAAQPGPRAPAAAAPAPVVHAPAPVVHAPAPVVHAPAVHIPVAAKSPIVHVPPAAPAPAEHVAPPAAEHVAPAPGEHVAPVVKVVPAPVAPPAKAPAALAAPAHAPAVHAAPIVHTPVVAPPARVPVARPPVTHVAPVHVAPAKAAAPAPVAPAHAPPPDRATPAGAKPPSGA